MSLNQVATTIKGYFVWILIIAVCILGYLLEQRKGGDGTDIIPNPVAMHTLDTMRDANNKLYSQLAQETYNRLQVQAYADSLAKALRVKPQYIQGEDQIVIKDSVIYKSVPSEPIYLERGKDTAYQVEVHDPWVDVVAIAGKDTGSISLKERDTLSRIEVVETPLIGKTKTTIFMGNSNPHDEVLQGASFSIKQKEVFLTIGPGIQYNPFTRKVNVGLSAQLPILKFKR